MQYKNLFITLAVLFVFVSFAFASDIQSVPFSNIKDGAKLSMQSGDNWSLKVNKKSQYFIKNGTEIFSKDNDIYFDTNCGYLFIDKGRLIGYSSENLKFYEFYLKGNNIDRRELLPDEVQILFKDFRVIRITEFSKTTNVYKFKKKRSCEKILVLNDTDREFSNYSFTTNNARFDLYSLNNIIGITKSGMIQFSKFGENSKNTPWFILLVR